MSNPMLETQNYLPAVAVGVGLIGAALLENVVFTSQRKMLGYEVANGKFGDVKHGPVSKKSPTYKLRRQGVRILATVGAVAVAVYSGDKNVSLMGYGAAGAFLANTMRDIVPQANPYTK